MNTLFHFRLNIFFLFNDEHRNLIQLPYNSKVLVYVNFYF